jgi:hypothetical protein
MVFDEMPAEFVAVIQADSVQFRFPASKGIFLLAVVMDGNHFHIRMETDTSGLNMRLGRLASRINNSLANFLTKHLDFDRS